MDKVPETRKDQLLKEQRELTEKIARDENIKKLSKQEKDKQAEIETFKTTNPGDQKRLNKLFLELKTIRKEAREITGEKEGERPIGLSDQIDSLLYMSLDSETLKNTTTGELEKLREQITGYLMPDMATLEQTTALANMLEEIELLIAEKNKKPEIKTPDSGKKKVVNIDKQIKDDIENELKKPLDSYSKEELAQHLIWLKTQLKWKGLKKLPKLEAQITAHIKIITEEMLSEKKPESPNEKKFTDFTSYETAEKMGEKREIPYNKKFTEFKGISPQVYLYKRTDGNYEMHLSREVYISGRTDGEYLRMFNLDPMKTDTTYMTIKPAIIKLNPDGSFEVLQNGEVREATPEPSKYEAPTETIKKGEPVPASAPRDASTPETKEGWTPEKEEILNNLLKAIEKSKKRIVELDVMKEALSKATSPDTESIEAETTKTFTIDFIKQKFKTLLSSQEAIKKINTLNIEGKGGEILLTIDFEAKKGKLIKGTVTATLVNNGNSIGINNFKVKASITDKLLITGFLKPELERVHEMLKKYIEQETRKRVKSIKIKNGEIEATFYPKK